MWKHLAAAACLLAFAATSPAFAGKADDTLRVATTDWWSTLDPYLFPDDEAGVYQMAVYEPLLRFDERKRQFVPRLAKSWKQIDDKTYEFELRDDVTFHNGDRFSADDVVTTLQYITDPAVLMRHKDNFDWIAKVEKLGPYTVRITAKSAFPTELQDLAYQVYIMDGKVLNALPNKADYGRTQPIGTGPLKVLSLDQTQMVMERYDAYYDKTRLAPIAHLIVKPIPDRQTQIAEFLTGNIDLIRNVPADMARDMAKSGAAITPVHNGMLMYATLDAMGRSDNKVMTDQRVRKAFMEAIDRQALAKTVIPGGEIADILDAVCIPAEFGCASTTKPPAYDPDDAKKLLAEAGYPNGFDVELDVHEPIKEIGEAIGGMLQKVGIRASVRPLPITLYTRLRGDGKFTAFVGFRPTNIQPDAGDIYEFFFSGNRDYWNDPVIKAAQAAGDKEFDPEKRIEDYERGFDQVNKMNDILPIADLPMVFVHSKEVNVIEDPRSPINLDAMDFVWAK